MSSDHTDVAPKMSNQSGESQATVSHEDSIHDTGIDDGEFPGDHRSKETEMRNPRPDSDELSNFVYIETLLREANSEVTIPIDEWTDPVETVVDRFFDDRILTYAPRALAASGIPLDSEEWDISEGYVRALTLQYTRKDGFREFADHLATTDATLTSLDLDGGTSKSALSARHCELSERQRETIRAAAIRAVHAAYRAGDPFPDEVWNRYATSDDPLSPVKPELLDKVESGYFDQETIDEALNNWAEWFFDNCLLPHIRFDRTNPSYPDEALIGMLSQAAIQEESLRNASKTAGRVVGYDVVPHEDTVIEPIRRMSVRSIDTMFQEARGAFFEGVLDYDPLEGAKLTFDLTDIPLDGPEIDDGWVKGNGGDPRNNDEPEADQKLEYGVLSVDDPELYFALGLFPLGSDLDQGDTLTRTLRPAIRDITASVGKLTTDGGLYGSGFIQHCRRVVGDDWMILAPAGKVKSIHENATEGESEFIHRDDVDVLNDLDEKPNIVVVPVPPWESINDVTHFALVTDLPEDEVDPDDFKNDYQNRNRIEHTIGQLKNQFEIPHNSNVSTEYDFFTRNLSLLFYNLWVLVNSCRSPKYGLPLGAKEFVSAKEVLQAIREVAFKRAREEKRNR